MSFSVVIPARYASTRLPGKPLLEIGGRPMIAHVHERALESGAETVIVATDDDRVRAAAQDFGARVCMTSPEHRSGSERLAEVVHSERFPADAIVVNVQGDEPLLPPANIAQVARNLAAHPECAAATLCEPITEREALFSPDVVKVVYTARGHALYFSRAPVPWDRDGFRLPSEGDPGAGIHMRHVGIYAYRSGYLARYVDLAPCAAEETEGLEQLRILHYGDRIHVEPAGEPSGPGVDTAEELESVRELVRGRSEGEGERP